MDLTRVLFALFYLKCITAIIYYSNTKRTFQDSVALCEHVNGDMLRYGEEFLISLLSCENRTGQVTVWTGTPYNDETGNCTGTAGEIKLQDGKDDKHVALCADVCASASYSYIGLTGQECTCYTDLPDDTQSCSHTSCPGNSLDHCGIGTQYALYNKEYEKNCRGRTFANINGNGDNFKVDTDVCGTYKENFLCKVGSTNDSNCDIDVLLTTIATDEFSTTQFLSTIENGKIKTTEDIHRPSTESEGQLSSDPVSVDTSLMVKKKLEDDSNSLALLIGVLIAVGVLLVLIVALAIYLRQSHIKKVNPEKTDNIE